MPNISTGEGGYWNAPDSFDASDFGYTPYTASQFGATNDSGPNTKVWNTHTGEFMDQSQVQNFGFIGDPNKYGGGMDWLSHMYNASTPGIGGQWNHANYMLTPEGEGAFSMMSKSGEKEGTRLRYVLNPATNKYELQGGGKEHWDTNNAKQNMDLLKVVTAAVGGAFMGPALEGAGAAISAGSAPTVSQMGTIANLVNTGTGGQIPGLNYAGALAGGYGALGNLASGSGSFMDAVRLASSANKLYGGYQNLTQDPRNPTGGGAGMPGMVGGANSQMPGGSGGGNMDWLSQLFNMGGSLYSANKNDNYADEMRAERERSLAERQPFLDRVGQLSGDAGAENFRSGGTWQAAERVAANNFTRKDAARGNLANDTDRTRLLQDHFMKNLEAERSGARGNLQAFDEKASRDALMKAIEMDRMKNSPLFAGAAYGAGGGAGTLAGMSPQIMDYLKQIPGGLQYLQQLMSGGGATSPMPSVPSGVAFDGDYTGATSPYDTAAPGFDYADDYSSWFGDDYFGGSGVEF